MTKFAVGIDLGTTYSAVAVYRNGHPEIIANSQGNRTTPSYVAFTPDGRLVGDAALLQAAENPKNTIYGIKRLMGRNFDDAAIQPDIHTWPFNVVQINDLIMIETQDHKQYYPEEISAIILEEMKTTAELFLGEEITDVVITCPAYFNNAQRQATKDAARIAGLNVKRMINEPTAAALAYGLNMCTKGTKNVLIFDFGGGTFDVSILKIKEKEMRVVATKGDTHLGGEDFDQRLVEYCLGEFKRKYNKKDITKDVTLMRNLKTHCERAKRILSIAPKAEFALEGTNMTCVITRTCFEDINLDLFKKSIEIVKEAIKDAKMTKQDIHEVVLVGGSSRIPKVKQLLSEFFDTKNLSYRVNSDEAVALGAAICAGLLQKEYLEVSELSEEIKGMTLSDVCPLSLGTKVVDGSVEIVIHRNTKLPAKSTVKLTTYEDNQSNVDISVYEGERLLAKDNHFLGEFIVPNLPRKPRGQVMIENMYNIDENGILTVSAHVIKSKRTSKQSLTIMNNSRLRPSEVERLVAEAAKFRNKDLTELARLTAFNELERFVHEVKGKINRMNEGSAKHKAKSMIGEYSSFLKKNPEAATKVCKVKKQNLKDRFKKIRSEYYRDLMFCKVSHEPTKKGLF